MPDPNGSRSSARPPLSGRTAVVTGAGNGLGRAISLQLAAAGVRVVATGRSIAPLAQTAEFIENSGYPIARVAQVDVADPQSVAALSRSLADEDISILVNNAGVPGPVSALIDIDLED